MLIPGIKLGPKDWLEKLNQSHAKCAEVWYRVEKPEWYPAMLQTLKDRGVIFGLHFWGITHSGHEANLAYPGPDRSESIELVIQCLQTAKDWGAVYVNLHSGNYRPMLLNLDNWSMIPDPNFPPLNIDEAVSLRHRALIQLGQLAHKFNIPLLVELVPLSTYQDDRNLFLPEYPVGPEGLLELCDQQIIGFTNDFCHTFAQKSHESRSNLLQNFNNITNQFLSHTRLCHINTVYEPYNGTDAHGGILESDFTKPGVFPTKAEYLHLLQTLNQTNHDVYLIGEPSENHVENYLELVKFISTL